MNKADQKYNGWTNYATWNANLWPINEEWTYKHIMSKRPYTPDSAWEEFNYLYPNGTPDMKPGDVDKVNWQEIANAWNEK